MSETSARFGLPMLAAGQSQKEVTHNEALAMLEIAVAASVVANNLAVPPVAPVPGQCWIVGSAATGAWIGMDSAIAGWTAGGWRFVRPRAGMLAWVEQAGRFARFANTGWVLDAPLGAPLPAIPLPAGGAVVDPEARFALNAIIAALQTLGLIQAQ